MLDEWTFVGLLVIVAAIFPAMPIIVAKVIGPRKPNKIKEETYECGIETVGDTWVQFKVQYYIFALVFLIFDVETVFLFPWAVAFNQMSFFMVFEGVLFILILAGALVYAWRKDILEWA